MSKMVPGNDIDMVKCRIRNGREAKLLESKCSIEECQSRPTFLIAQQKESAQSVLNRFRFFYTYFFYVIFRLIPRQHVQLIKCFCSRFSTYLYLPSIYEQFAVWIMIYTLC